MLFSYVHKSFSLDVPFADFLASFEKQLKTFDIVRIQEKDGCFHCRNTSLTFSSTKPLTCISRMQITSDNDQSFPSITIAMNFIKIKLYTIFVIVLFSAVLPMAMNYYRYGSPVLPKIAVIGIPLGFFLYYHVRGRALRAVDRLVRQVELIVEQVR